MLEARPEIFFISLLFLSPAVTLGDTDRNADPLLGAWRVVSVHVDGQRQKQSDWEVSDEIVFDGEEVDGLFSFGNKVRISILKQFPNKSPKQFKRFTLPERGDDKLYIIAVGMYAISGDTLTWCEVYPDKPAPKEFKTVKGDHRTLIVLKRTKATPTNPR